MKSPRFFTASTLLLTGLSMLFFTGCTPETRLLNKIPVNSVEVQVLDKNDQPVNGAQVEASNGRKTTTDGEGIANVRFGSVGVYSITVYTDNHMPNNLIVTLPTDRGEQFTARLADSIEFTGISFGAMNMYPLIFNYLFSSYGYGLEFDAYREGQWTTWNITADEEDEPMRMTKGFLKQLDNGQQWWQIILDNADEEASSYTAEVLFSEDRSTIVRYREQIGDNETQEKPVSEGWYTEPTQLTDESKQGALSEENIEITIPSGTFTADKLIFGVAPEISLNIWSTNEDGIPGGVLKYETTSDDEFMYKSELHDYGNDAGTRLNSF